MAGQAIQSVQQDRERRSPGPTVELLVPVCHPGRELDRLLYRMAKQSYPLTGVRLLVTASEEDYAGLVRRYSQVWKKASMEKRTDGSTAAESETAISFTRIDPQEFDHGGTRDLGARASRADLLLFMTQDAVPADDRMVERLAERFCLADGSGISVPIAAAYARQLPKEDCHLIERYTRRFNYPGESRIKTKADLPGLGIKTYFCSNVCAMYDRAVYEKLGGFIQHTIFNEDMIYAAAAVQAGFGIAYAADARVIHSHNYSAMQQLRRNFDLAVSQADHPEVFAGVPSEGEGIRMVKQTMAYLCGRGRADLIPKLIWQSGWKYAGYLLGKRYRRLPDCLVMKLTMNPRYWKNS